MKFPLAMCAAGLCEDVSALRAGPEESGALSAFEAARIQMWRALNVAAVLGNMLLDADEGISQR